ncbi:MAG: WD40 repeat domain-containing protein [Oligoflexia bacterium]|nr:WD40 repeat domain-containing protein [Oligoflexia bacterium]
MSRLNQSQDRPDAEEIPKEFMDASDFTEEYAKEVRKQLSGVPILKHECSAEIGDYVVDLRYSPDGKNVAVASAQGRIHILNSDDLKSRHVFEGHELGTLTVAWSKDSQLLASGGQDGKFKLWDLSSGRRIIEQNGGSAWVEHVRFSPDSGSEARIVTASGKVLRVWSSTGELIQEFEPHPNTVSGVEWRGSSERLITSCYGGIRLWEMGSPQPKRLFGWKGSPISLKLGPNGKWVACGSQDSSVHIWKTVSGEDLEMSGYPVKVKELAWSPDSRYLATGGGAELTIWDFSGKGPAGSKPLVRSGHVELIAGMEFQPKKGSAFLASLGKEGALFFWNLEGRKKPLGLGYRVGQGEGSRLAWSPDGAAVVTGYASGEVCLWRAPALD